ncbi:hypothetical protein EDB87DRAFT_1166489 [Lactarius vividus]|nr:hypothetical protein EDB87DRAFT_1166489 [Lactarius vividus]
MPRVFWNVEGEAFSERVEQTDGNSKDGERHKTPTSAAVGGIIAIKRVYFTPITIFGNSTSGWHASDGANFALIYSGRAGFDTSMSRVHDTAINPGRGDHATLCPVPNPAAAIVRPTHQLERPTHHGFQLPFSAFHVAGSSLLESTSTFPSPFPSAWHARFAPIHVLGPTSTCKAVLRQSALEIPVAPPSRMNQMQMLPLSSRLLPTLPFPSRSTCYKPQIHRLYVRPPLLGCISRRSRNEYIILEQSAISFGRLSSALRDRQREDGARASV